MSETRLPPARMPVSKAETGNLYVSIYPVDPMPDAITALREGSEPVWLFAYGSLMWNPEFAFAEAQPAYLYGYHRSFCLYSRDYRGTPERPGLVLGLDRGGSCHGIAYRLAPGRVGEALDRIWAREMTGRVYQMRRVAVRTSHGEAPAYACVVRRQSPDYAGRLSPAVSARLLADAVGGRGTGRDYLASTVRHLAALGIRDGLLNRIDAEVKALAPVPEAAIPGDAGSNAQKPAIRHQIADQPDDQS